MDQVLFDECLVKFKVKRERTWKRLEDLADGAVLVPRFVSLLNLTSSYESTGFKLRIFDILIRKSKRRFERTEPKPGSDTANSKTWLELNQTNGVSYVLWKACTQETAQLLPSMRYIVVALSSLFCQPETGTSESSKMMILSALCPAGRVCGLLFTDMFFFF